MPTLLAKKIGECSNGAVFASLGQTADRHAQRRLKVSKSKVGNAYAAVRTQNHQIPLFKFSQVGEAVRQVAQLDFIHLPRALFLVKAIKGTVAPSEEFEGVFHLRGLSESFSTSN